MMDWKEVIPGKVALKFNQQRDVFHYFSLGEIMNGTLFEHKAAAANNVQINIVSKPSEHIEGDFDQFSTFYKVGSDWILYERKYGGFTCELLIQGLFTPNMTVFVNTFYLNYVKAKIDGLYPVGVHLADIILCDIFGRNDLVIHGASLRKPGKGSFLLVAPPDTGKTYTTYQLLQKGYKFLGEDLSYYDSKTDSLVCMPYTSTWGHRFSFKKVDFSKIPFVGLLANDAKKSVEDIFGKDSVAETAKLQTIYLMQKSDKNQITKVELSTELMRKIMAIQRNEFSYYKNPLIRAYEYYKDLDIDAIADAEKANMKKLLGTKDLFLVEATDYTEFEKLIDGRENQSK